MAALLFIIITNILTLNPLFIDTAAVMTSMIWCLYYTYKQKKTKEQYIQTQAIRINAMQEETFWYRLYSMQTGRECKHAGRDAY